MRKNGFTLIEAVLVMVVFGLIMALGFPRMSRALSKADVRSARTALASMYAQARAVAVRYNRTAAVAFNGNNAIITMRPRLANPAAGDYDTVSLVDMAARYGVTVTRSAGMQDSLRVDPRGFGMTGTTAATVWVARDGYSDSIIVNAFGKLVTR